MSKRAFVETVEREGGKPVGRYRLTCGQCGVSHALGRQNFGGRLAVELVPKKFAALGWVVGHRQDGADDRCPACVSREAEQQRRANLRLVTSEGDMSQAVAKADPPREMDRTDRRLIIEKLSEVYVDEQTGYSAGWTDKKVAETLGVPRAWVVKLRDENFGPARSPEIEDALKEARAVAGEVRTLSETLSAVTKQLGVLADRAGRIERIAGEIEKAVR